MFYVCEVYFRMYIYYEYSNGLYVVCRRVFFKVVVEYGKVELEVVGFNFLCFFNLLFDVIMDLDNRIEFLFRMRW